MRQLFDERDVADVLRYEGGYEHVDGLWWAPGATTTYSAANFYLPVRQNDAVGRQKSVRYGSSGQSIAETQDGFGNVERFVYQTRAAKVWQRIDANHNVVADRFDPLGNLLSRAVMGKADQKQGDSLALDIREATGRDDPTLVITYGTYDRSTGVPSFVRIRRRAEYRGDKANLIDSFVFYDSEGRTLGRSSRSDDGAWLVSDYVQLNSSGQIVSVARPFLSDSAWPMCNKGKGALKDSFAFKYDALGRVVRVDQPGGTYLSRLNSRLGRSQSLTPMTIFWIPVGTPNATALPKGAPLTLPLGPSNSMKRAPPRWLLCTPTRQPLKRLTPTGESCSKSER